MSEEPSEDSNTVTIKIANSEESFIFKTAAQCTLAQLRTIVATSDSEFLKENAAHGRFIQRGKILTDDENNFLEKNAVLHLVAPARAADGRHGNSGAAAESSSSRTPAARAPSGFHGNGNHQIQIQISNGQVRQIRPQDASTQSQAQASAQSARRLITAIRCGRVEEIRSLLAAGAPAHVQVQRTTPLHIAAMGDSVVALRLILAARNVHVNLTNAQGETALHYAAHYNKHENVAVLIEAGANVWRLSQAGLAAVHLAKTLECLTPILSHAARCESGGVCVARVAQVVSTRNSVGLTALALMIHSKSVQCMQKLFSYCLLPRDAPCTCRCAACDASCTVAARSIYKTMLLDRFESNHCQIAMKTNDAAIISFVKEKFRESGFANHLTEEEIEQRYFQA